MNSEQLSKLWSLRWIRYPSLYCYYLLVAYCVLIGLAGMYELWDRYFFDPEVYHHLYGDVPRHIILLRALATTISFAATLWAIRKLSLRRWRALAILAFLVFTAIINDQTYAP